MPKNPNRNEIAIAINDYSVNAIEKDLNYSHTMLRQKRIANKIAKIAKEIAIVCDSEHITPDSLSHTILTNFYDLMEIDRLKQDVRELNRHIENKLLTIYSTIK